MTLIEIIGNQHLRILALEETLGQREAEISRLNEKVMKLTPSEPAGDEASPTGSTGTEQAPSSVGVTGSDVL